MFRKLLLFTVLLSSVTAFGQNSKIERYILGTGGTLTDTLDNGTVIVLDLSTDDAEQENDEVDGPYDDDLDCGWEGAPDDQNILTLGLRFRELFIPQGATIDSAFIVLHAHEGKSAEDVAIINIYGEDTDDAATFDETNFNENKLITDRPKTSASTKWTVAEDWTIWKPYQSADIGPIIEEIVGRSGWESGNSIALILQGEDQGPSTVENAREFTAFENIADPDDVDPSGTPGDGKNHPERRPLLVVYVNGTLNAVSLNQPTFKLYPNPVNNQVLNLNLNEDAPAEIEIYDLSGVKVRSYATQGNTATLNLNGLSPQLYLIKVSQNGAVATQKFSVQ